MAHDRTHTHRYEVVCNNCGKRQYSSMRLLIDECELCGQSEITDYAAQMAHSDRRVARPPDLNDPYRHAKQLEAIGQPTNRTSDDDEITFLDKLTLGLFGVACGLLFGGGYYGMMTFDPATTAERGVVTMPEVAGFALFVMPGLLLCATFVLWLVGAALDRGLDALAHHVIDSKLNDEDTDR